MRKLIALLVLLWPVGLQAETLVRHCANLVSGSCQSSVYVRPADATLVRVLRTNAPWVSLNSVLETERISVCVDDSTVAVGSAGPCTTRVPGRTDNWQLKSLVYTALPAPPGDPTWTGTATVAWIAPTTYTDGSALTNLAGFRVYYGTSTELSQSVTLANPAVRSHVLSGLTAGTWYAAVTALTSEGAESEYSDVVSITLPVPSTCAAKPADETRMSQCTAPAVGSWTQTRTYASAAYPTCWTPGEWLPASAPAGACTVPEIWKVAPTSSNVRPVYEAVLNSAGNALVRGNREGSIASGQPCGEEKFKVSRNSYRAVTESDVSLDSPTYKGREHVAICVR